MTTDDSFKKWFYEIIFKNPNLLESLKISEDKEKIYTPLGYIRKSDLKEQQ